MSVNKIFVSQMGFGFNTNNIGFQAAYVDVANGVVVEQYGGGLLIGTEAINFSPGEIKAAIEAQLVAYAITQSYPVTADDIAWSAPFMFTIPEVEAEKGITSSIIDGKSVGNTTIFTNNSGKDFLVTEYWIKPTTITGLGTAPIINLGKTASAYNDIDSGISLAFANNANKWSKKDALTNSVVVANGESLVARVATGAILTTAYSFKIMVRGVYL